MLASADISTNDFVLKVTIDIGNAPPPYLQNVDFFEEVGKNRNSSFMFLGVFAD